MCEKVVYDICMITQKCFKKSKSELKTQQSKIAHLRSVSICDLICDSAPAIATLHVNACDAPGQGILLTWRASTGTDLQVKLQVDTQLYMALKL
jgi:hypothetical protein